METIGVILIYVHTFFGKYLQTLAQQWMYLYCWQEVINKKLLNPAIELGHIQNKWYTVSVPFLYISF